MIYFVSLESNKERFLFQKRNVDHNGKISHPQIKIK